MTGYMYVFGHCCGCGNPFSFHPDHVPSLTVNGEREPVCRECFEKWKKIHNKPDHPLHPLAYEPAEV